MLDQRSRVCEFGLNFGGRRAEHDDEVGKLGLRSTDDA